MSGENEGEGKIKYRKQKSFCPLVNQSLKIY